MSKQYVFHFKEAYGLGKELLGGKGAGLAEMTHIGVPIPQGFTITTEACNLYYESGKKLPEFLVKDVKDAIKVVEKETGKNFGGTKNPLLVSVRSGARVSMPGMMDTILNLGLNDTTVEVLAKETNNERFAYDSYRRFILMFTNIAKGHPRTAMDKMLEELGNKELALTIFYLLIFLPVTITILLDYEVFSLFIIILYEIAMLLMGTPWR